MSWEDTHLLRRNDGPLSMLVIAGPHDGAVFEGEVTSHKFCFCNDDFWYKLIAYDVEVDARRFTYLAAVPDDWGDEETKVATRIASRNIRRALGEYKPKHFAITRIHIED